MSAPRKLDEMRTILAIRRPLQACTSFLCEPPTDCIALHRMHVYRTVLMRTSTTAWFGGKSGPGLTGRLFMRDSACLVVPYLLLSTLVLTDASKPDAHTQTSNQPFATNLVIATRALWFALAIRDANKPARFPAPTQMSA